MLFRSAVARMVRPVLVWDTTMAVHLLLARVPHLHIYSVLILDPPTIQVGISEQFVPIIIPSKRK